MIFSCMDDGDEQNWVTFSKAKMLSLTAGTAADASGSTATVTLGGDIFANTNNDETMIRGIKRAVVKVDVNPEDTLIKFAPKDLESEMGEPTAWVSGGEDLVGYFKSPNTRTTLDGQTMSALVYGSTGGFERRIIFTSAEAEDGIHDSCGYDADTARLCARFADYHDADKAGDGLRRRFAENQGNVV